MTEPRWYVWDIWEVEWSENEERHYKTNRLATVIAPTREDVVDHAETLLYFQPTLDYEIVKVK